MDEESQSSLECIQANQIFPRKQLIREDETLQVPFQELHGESTEFVGRAEDAVISLSSYRLNIKYKESSINVPLQMIESVECRDPFQLHLTCKDCKVIRCQFSNFEQVQEWQKRMNAALRPPSRIEDFFSFAYHAWCMEVYASEKEQHGDLCRPGDHVISRFKNEVERMGFDMDNAWRISNINEKFRLCPSYPQELIIPAWITDKELESVASFRSWKRIPAVVYRHQSNGAVIARCGQPEVSWWGWRNADDEHLVQSVAKACATDSSRASPGKMANGSCHRNHINGGVLADVDFESSLSNIPPPESPSVQPQKLLILDARSYAAAVANRAKGGGCECPEYYPNCEVVFMGMANIHYIRKSFQSLRLLCTQTPDPANWLSALEGTKWLQHLSMLLKSSLLVVHTLDKDQRPVLVHCSDGWDRTPQIVALSKLLLDPYYRTIEGFQVLVEMEWLDFGHKFADRCGHGENSEDLNERCPVFLQWLDCVHQLHRQFPCSFEFNEAFLVKLVQHTYSCLFGTFLCNNAKERSEKHIQERTCSVWSLLRAGNRAFKNLLYSSQSETVLYPVCHVRNLMLWSAVYLPGSSPSTPSEESCTPYPASGSATEEPPVCRLSKTRSYDDLPSACDMMVPCMNRRSSDPSLNDKWQDHRRSLELSLGNEGYEGDRQPLGAQLSMAAGVGEGQMENILQEASKEEGVIEEPGGKPGKGQEECLKIEQANSLEVSVKGEEVLDLTRNAPNVQSNEGLPDRDQECANPKPGGECDNFSNGKICNTEDTELDESSPREFCDEECANPVPENLTFKSEVNTKQNGFESEVDASQMPEKPSFKSEGDTEQNGIESEEGASQVPEKPYFKSEGDTEQNGVEFEEGASQVPKNHNGVKIDKDIQNSPSPLPSALPSSHVVLEDSTDTLTEDPVVSWPCKLDHVTAANELSQRPENSSTEGLIMMGLRGLQLQSERTCMPPMLSHGAFHNSECKVQIHCNRDLLSFPSLDGSCLNGDSRRGKPGLSRQNSSTNTPQPHLRNTPHKCPLHSGGRNRIGSPPEQQARNHLDDDGMPLYVDTIQQRLRQMECGHQQEVETLKKQVRELRCQLENFFPNSPLRFNGEFADEVNSIQDTESNRDPGCLSGCSTEHFSEASWEQVDKRNTELTRWVPDHVALNCYNCDSTFWLASRKHHCRNCGNVFCSSCCNQKAAVPSQQLFEPSRVCKLCYTNLHPSRELENPIAATSN
ncbi:myotubularin related protein 3 homeolog L [Xenopus laevis]|uniref:phosphatidylinositol-3,5-bisphosphate 3-phosphatase n=1 Tax=Xenopus laevis TaxID=8355 RepID=Q6PCI5_XENLA|nr:myotubularin related protein 3 homeolog L [Xenopus laevis]AAH59312.1 Mtmr3 protein [Xenopus laevis]